MAVYKLFPEKDASLYSKFNTQNTGLDEIIEASTTFTPGKPQVSRFLIQFSQDEISELINNTILGSVTDETGSLLTSSKEFKADLKTFIAEVDGLSTNTTLESYPISQTWNMGTGKYNDSPKIEDGCSWKYRLENGSGPWIEGGLNSNEAANYPEDNPGGGTWFTGTINGLPVGASQILNYSSNKDIKMDVTNAIKLINSGTIDNNGFIIKQSDSDEFKESEAKTANIKYFSIDTHTIYPPQLEIKWRDWVYANTSSFLVTTEESEYYSTIDTESIIHTSDLVATLAQNKGEYRRGSIQKFYINCRPQFPERTFETGSAYTKNYFLPTASYYAVKDLATNEFIIDFDTDYTQISADLDGSYFKLYMNGLEPERYYQILIKTEIQGSTLLLDDNYYFKVING